MTDPKTSQRTRAYVEWKRRNKDLMDARDKENATDPDYVDRKEKEAEELKLELDYWTNQIDEWAVTRPEPRVIDVDLSDVTISDLGEIAFNLWWESDRMGADGLFSIVRLGSIYVCISASETFGPFFSLKEALQESGFRIVTSATKSIECSEMDAETVSGLLTPSDGDDIQAGHTIKINNEQWIFDSNLRLKQYK